MENTSRRPNNWSPLPTILSLGNNPLPWQQPSPLATTLSLGNNPLPFNNPLLFVIPSEAEGSAVLRTLPGNAKHFTQTATQHWTKPRVRLCGFFYFSRV
jgi:hypothetical protein